jgi:DNA polymerase elongation subunit (family B)
MPKVISIDTDGVYCDDKIDLKEMNDYLDRITKETFNLENYLHMDMDEYDAAFFRETKGKNYVLKEGDKITFHGASFKGSHMPVFFDKVLDQVTKDMFNGVTSKTVDVRSFPIEDLIQNIKVKAEASYKSDSSLSMQLIKQVKIEMPDVKLTDTDQLAYIKTNKGYELVMPNKKYGEIDWDYYQAIIDKIYERLKIEDTKQMTFG